ncbi:MAG: RHS repeat-associated core domain-containing protein, partial [Candidatus Hadarchaeum sp.]|uniref:RHS repeat-associated core domain-containing protein n=1 Tax=Candidatus Hadarchaeum sp. TaxID=2883567 RepID=UPI003D0B5754
LHARWYHPYMMRFLSPDPLRGDPRSPQSLNLFAYVKGNPRNFVDPWGLAAVGTGPNGDSKPEKDGYCDGTTSDPDCQYHEDVTVIGTIYRYPLLTLGVPLWMVDVVELYIDRYVASDTFFGRPGITSDLGNRWQRFWRWVEQNTDAGVSVSAYYKGWSFSLDQWGQCGGGTLALGDLACGTSENVQSWVVGADLWLHLFSPDKMRTVDPPQVGIGFGFPGFGRLPGVEVLFTRSGAFGGVVVHFGPSFFFPPGWVTRY